jgi:hypothetical protein
MVSSFLQPKALVTSKTTSEQVKEYVKKTTKKNFYGSNDGRE